MKIARSPKTGSMKFKKRSVVIIIVIVAIVTAAAVILFFESGSFSKKQMLNIKNVHYTDVGASGMKWEINADSAKYVKNENLVLFDRIRVKLVMSDGRTLVMTGDKGKSNTETKDMEVSGNVEITSDKGDRLTTDILRYSGAEQRIYTDSAVKMENSRMQVKGVGMWHCCQR